MKVLFLNESGVEQLLAMEACIPLMRETLETLARGDAVLPLRNMVRLPDGSGILGLMPGYLAKPESFGLKVVSVMPGNHGTPYDSHQGVVMLFGVKHGEPLAILDATAITAIRTAAVSGAATQALARADAGDLALLGSGVQARTHLPAMAAVRTLRRVRVWSRTHAHAEAFASSNRAASNGVAIEVSASAEEAVRGADLICTTTATKQPILEGRWLSAGAHINAVGACFPACRELDTEAVVRSRFYCDRRESVGSEAGDFLIPRREGAIGSDHIVGEIGEVAIGRAPGRSRPDEITLFKSLGIAVEDVAAAEHIHRRARAVGKGFLVDLGGRRMTYD